MKAYGITYTYNGRPFNVNIDARDKTAARNKIGRRHGLNATQSARQIKIVRCSVIGYY